MTATFWCPDAPREEQRVPCDSPNHHIPCTPEERCGYCNDGWQTEWVTECPQFTLSNHNTRNVMELLGLGRETYGTVPAKDIPPVLQRIMVVLAKDGERTHLICETADERGQARIVKDENGIDRITSGPRMIDCGNDDSQTVARLQAFQRLLVWAQERGYDVGWG